VYLHQKVANSAGGPNSPEYNFITDLKQAAKVIKLKRKKGGWMM